MKIKAANAATAAPNKNVTVGVYACHKYPAINPAGKAARPIAIWKVPIAVPNSYKRNMYYERIHDPMNTYYQFENEYQSFSRHSKILDSQNVVLQRYLNESEEEYDTRLIEIILNHFKNIYVSC